MSCSRSYFSLGLFGRCPSAFHWLDPPGSLYRVLLVITSTRRPGGWTMSLGFSCSLCNPALPALPCIICLHSLLCVVSLHPCIPAPPKILCGRGSDGHYLNSAWGLHCQSWTMSLGFSCSPWSEPCLPCLLCIVSSHTCIHVTPKILGGRGRS